MSAMTTIRNIRDKKLNKEKISALTAYDFLTARALDEAGIDILLVGDSLGCVVYGYDSTVAVTMEDVLRHTKAVVNGAKKSLVIADMPFGSYHASLELAVKNAIELVQVGAKGVKVEGATPFVIEAIQRMIEAGIVVVGHLGFTPQQVNRFGGNVIQGKDAQAAQRIVSEALELERIGVQALVLELVPEKLAAEITSSLQIPTIGIGAGRYCDGQILVTHDLLGLTGFKPKFLKQYASLDKTIKLAVKAYIADVGANVFPAEENIY